MQYDLFKHTSEKTAPRAGQKQPVQAPPFHPFSPDENVREGELQQGQQVGLILGDSSRSPTGRRVVIGEVTGYAVRHPDYFDLQLTNILTWIYHNPPHHIQQLDDNFLGNFRINIQQSIRHTFDVLRSGSGEGRSLVAAQEVPFHRCWACRRPIEIERDGVFCPNCGVRLSVGEQRHTPFSPPQEEEACPACWHPNESNTAHCRYCGFERSLNARAEAAVGETVYLELVEQHQKRARMRGKLEDLRIEKVFRHRGPELVGHVGQIQFEGHPPDQAEHIELSASFSAQLTLEVDEQFFEESINRLETGDRLRASELKARCPHCLEWERREEYPFALGRFCGRCGERVRLLPHPEWSKRGQPPQNQSAIRHYCGTYFRQGVDRFCTGCGDDVQNFRPGSGRFSQLG